MGHACPQGVSGGRGTAACFPIDRQAFLIDWFMKSFSGQAALIVEPQSGMRTSLHNMLNQCEITKIDHAVSSGTAIRSLQARTYDIILCEYNLGEGQDGQQLLEDLRHHKLIPLSTIFIMVTAERTQTKVVSAAELAPTEYLLKPFTADALLERIGRAVERRTDLMPVYQLMEHGSLTQAVATCIEGERATPKFLVDFMRLRAELHVTLGQSGEAEAIYTKLHHVRGVAWARAVRTPAIRLPPARARSDSQCSKAM